MKSLENKNKIKIVFGKYTDNRSARGWDYMNGCYLPEENEPEYSQLVISPSCTKGEAET